MCDIVKSESEINAFIDNRLSTASQDKQAIVLVGGPGSGKSSGKNATINYIGKTYQDFANIDPDEILSKLFNNDNTCRQIVNDINDKSYEMAIEQNKNIIFDGTGRDFEWYSTDVLKKLKDNEYHVILVIVINNLENVLPRIKQRAEEVGRDVSEDYTRSVYETLSLAIPKYLSLDCEYADHIYLYDNSKESIHLIYKTSCKDGVKKMIGGGKIPSTKNKKSRRKTTRKSRRKTTRKSRRRTTRKSTRKSTKK